MHRKPGIPGSLIVMLLLAALPALAGGVGGTIKVGAISLDEEAGDRSAVPETYNIYEGFSVSRINLFGRLGARNTYHLDLNEVNLNSARGLFSYRMPGIGNLSARHDRWRQIYDADGAVSSERRDWNFGLGLTPADWLRLSADYGLQWRDGDRLGLPVGTDSALGASYDYQLRRGHFEAEGRKDGRTVAVGWETSSLTDDLHPVADRTGNVVSLRASAPCLLLPELTHFVRASYGKQELDEAALDYTLSTFQYLGIVRPARDFQFRYRLDLSRVENDVDGLQTDLVRNDVDLTWYHARGSLTGGYGYVTNDDDRSLTSYDDWRVGGTFRHGKLLQAKASYSASDKQDQESLTLLKDIESSRLRASLQSQPVGPLTLGVSYVERDRKLPVIGVSANGQRYGAFGRYAWEGMGAVCVDFSYSDDEYADRIGRFRADNATVTGRVEVDAITDLKLSGGVTYLDLGQDVDIEKSILSFEGHYDFAHDYFVEVKYNVYNYDDYILLDRYYTANVVWLNVGYNLSID